MILEKDRWTETELREIWDWREQRKDRGVGFSVPQFEWWLLLHFEDGGGVLTQREVLERLCVFIPNYQKGNPNQLDFVTDAIVTAVQRVSSKVNSLPYQSEERGAIAGAWCPLTCR